MKVVFFHRKPNPGNFSIEIIFKEIRHALENKIDCQVAESSYFSRGFINRVKNMLEARNRQGDINHITGDVNYLVMALDKRKTILTVHDCGFMKDYSGWKRKILYWFWLKFPIRYATIITAVSHSAKAELLSYVDCHESKIRVIPNFTFPRFKRVSKPFNRLKPVILQIGTKHNKNLERIIPALEGISCHLNIIGKLSAEQNRLLEKFNIDFSNVFDLSDEEIVLRYNESDMVILASTHEGFGMPVIEANAVGRAVVVSNVASLPEVGADAACYVDPYEVTSIREGVLRVIEDSGYREELIRNGFKNAKKYELETIAGKYLELYADIYQGLQA